VTSAAPIPPAGSGPPPLPCGQLLVVWNRGESAGPGQPPWVRTMGGPGGVGRPARPGRRAAGERGPPLRPRPCCRPGSPWTMRWQDASSTSRSRSGLADQGERGQGRDHDDSRVNRVQPADSVVLPTTAGGRPSLRELTGRSGRPLGGGARGGQVTSTGPGAVARPGAPSSRRSLATSRPATGCSRPNLSRCSAGRPRSCLTCAARRSWAQRRPGSCSTSAARRRRPAPGSSSGDPTASRSARCGSSVSTASSTSARRRGAPSPDRAAADTAPRHGRGEWPSGPDRPSTAARAASLLPSRGAQQDVVLSLLM
jgi:hypothetical protein